MGREGLFRSESRLLSSSPSNDFSLYGAPSDGAVSTSSPAALATLPVAGTPTAPAAVLNLVATVRPATDSAFGPSHDMSAPVAGSSGGPQLLAMTTFPTENLIRPDAASPTSSITPASYLAETLPVPSLQHVVGGAAAATPAALTAPTLQPIPYGAEQPAPLVPLHSDPAVRAVPLHSDAGVPVVHALSAPVLHGTEPSLSTIADAAAVVAPAIGAAAGPADDAVHDLLGSDPAGGIATLVSLVTVADVLDLRDAGGAGHSDATPDPTLAMLDGLAADVPHDAVQPVADHHDEASHDSIPAVPGIPASPSIPGIPDPLHAPDDGGFHLGI